MSQVEHFDSVAITIVPSILKNKLYKFWNEIKRTFRITVTFTSALTMAAVLATTEKFKNFLGIPGERWGAIFSIALFISLGIFAWDCMHFFLKWKNGNMTTVEKFVDDLTGEEKNKKVV